MKQKEEIKRLFELYLEGRTNTQQEEILFNHLKKRNDGHNSDHDFFEVMKNSWKNEPSYRDNSIQTEESLDQLWNKVAEKKQKRAYRFQALKYAASVLLVMMGGLTWYTYQKGKQETIKAIELITKITGSGEKLKLTLPDSTIVYLGGNSKLSFPKRFVKGKYRNIHIDGEAFFEVKRDTTSPFIVQTSTLRTKVLGTSFNVYAYKGDRLSSITVRTGKVAVAETANGNQRELSLLTAGMKLVYHKGQGKHKVSMERVDDADSWTKNRFTFRNESLTSMLLKLERYYNVKFIFKKIQLDAYQFNVTFSNTNIKNVMDQLRIMTGNHIQYKINDSAKTITIWEEANKR